MPFVTRTTPARPRSALRHSARRRAALALAAAAMLATGGAAASTGAGTAGTVRLTGSVATDCQLSINDHGRMLDILSGVTDFTLGSVGERCNSGTGFTVTISSANGGVMRNERGDTVPYTIAWHDSGWRGLTTPVVLTRNSARPTVWTQAFRVTVPATPQAIAGHYSDTVTMTIAAR